MSFTSGGHTHEHAEKHSLLTVALIHGYTRKVYLSIKHPAHMHTCTFLPVKSHYRQVRLLYSFFKLVAMAAAGEKNGRLWVAPTSQATGLLLQRV